MPFSKLGKISERKWTDTYNELFKPAIEEAGLDYTCIRSTIRNGSFTKDILQNLKNARVVLADVSGTNPNVMWELGVRHTFSRRTIMVVRKDMSAERIISDLKNYGVIDYTLSPLRKVNQFKMRVKELLEGIENEPDRNDSPVFDFFKDEEIILSSQEKNKIISNLNGLLSELLSNLDLAEDIDNGTANVDLKTTTLRRFQTVSMDYILSTNYVSAEETFYKKIFVLRDDINAINRRLDMIMLDKRLKQNHRHSETIRNKIPNIITKIKLAIKKSNQLRKNIRKAMPEYIEPPTIFINQEHQKLLE